MKCNPIAKELFGSVEASQGYAYISDVIEDMDLSNEQVVNLAKSSLEDTKITIKILKDFIKKYKKKG